MSVIRKQEIGVGLLVLGALVILGYMAIQVGALKGFGETLQATARLDDAAGLTNGSLIKIAGVEIGQVDRLVIDHDAVVVEMVIDSDALIRQDAQVQVRARSLLGEKYLEVLPESTDAPLLEDGGVLSQSAGMTEIDQLVNALGPLVDSVDPAAVGGVLGHLNMVIEKDPERIERMLDDVELILKRTAEVSEQAPALVEETRGLVAEAGSTMAEVKLLVAQTRPTLERLDQVVERLDVASEDLPGTVEKTEQLLEESHGLMLDGRALVSRIDDSYGDVELVLANMKEIDKWELRRLLREEGILVRTREKEVIENLE